MSTATAEPIITRTLRDLLFREAHLKLARQRLTPLWTTKEAELRAVQSSRSPFDLILPGRKHHYQARLTAAQEAVNSLRERVELLDRCEPHIARRIEDAVEAILRESCPDYVEALAAQRQKEDWLRCLERFGTRIYEMTRALGNVRNLACSGYARHTHAYSAGALQAFQLAYDAALAVDQEVRFANQIAEAQVRRFRESGVVARSLPQLPDTDFPAWVSRIRGLRLTEAQQEFDALIEEAKRLYETGIAELRAQADQVEHEQEAEIRNFLLVAWDQFRREVAVEIFPGDTERVMEETGRMLEASARASVIGRL